MPKVLVIVPKNAEQVSKLTAGQAKELLAYLVTKLDEVDMEDFFGTEGWRHYFGLED